MNLALHNWTHALATVKTWQLKNFPVLRDKLGKVFIWCTSYVASKMHLFPEYDWDHQVVSASYWNIKKIDHLADISIPTVYVFKAYL